MQADTITLMHRALPLLGKVPLFSDLSEEQCLELWQQSRLRQYPEGSTLMAQGDEADEALLILIGSATVSRKVREASHTLRIAQAGDLLGEMALISGHARSATVMAHDDCQVLAISRDVFRSMLRANPDFTFRIMDMLCQRIIEGNNAWSMAHSYGTEARVASLLLDLQDRFPTEENGRHYIGVRLTHADLANMLGIARENVTKSLTKFRKAGAIAVEKRRMEILNADELRSWIC